ncbi:MAG: winged helix-turn-helix transcriptional regulator [Candidatus Aenigmarchaeota archaeon]|nr:winged helix-turn-helix transcriptional regulator [Candidatus Aenigmarchaeota archaeon]
MKGSFIEKEGERQKVYDAKLISPNGMKSLSSPLAGKIIAELARHPQCAMDVSRNLKENEQKIYYYLRGLEKAGVIEKAGEEQRYGMVAKIFRAVSPVVATKLYDDGKIIENINPSNDPVVMDFFRPFIENGRFNATVVFGDPYPHGKFDTGARDGLFIFDLALFVGKMLKEVDFHRYRLDTEVDEDDLKENLIVIGNAKINMIINRMNFSMPAYFDAQKGWALVLKDSGKTYDDARIGVIMKIDSPFSQKKKILIIGGVGMRGTKAAVLAIVNHTDKVMEKIKEDKFAVVEGYDRDGDKIIESVNIIG